MRHKVFLALLFVVSTAWLQGQQNHWSTLADQHKLNKQGMYFLGTWGLANLGTGLVFMHNSQNEWKFFHPMNAGWGAVNVGLATMSWFQANRALGRANKGKQQKPTFFKNLFLINTCLDLGYMGGGIYLNSVASRQKNPDQWKGFGTSILMQGAFLFLFDGIMYLKHRQIHKGYKNHLKAIDQ